MIRIGDFSKLSRTSIKTLRFYDEMDLLKPIAVDPLTGYRYYEYAQLSRLYRILALKDLGFSLEEIGRLLESNLKIDEMRGMLKLRQSEILERIQDEGQRLERVDGWLRQLEQEDKMSNYDVIIKKVEATKIASVRGIVPTPPEQGGLWNRLESWLKLHGVQPAGPCFSLYHDSEHKDQDWDIETCEPILMDLVSGNGIKVYDLPGENTMACTVHMGSFLTIGSAYDAILKWLDEHGYDVTGPCREIYLQAPRRPGDQNDSQTVTEIQFPVIKK